MPPIELRTDGPEGLGDTVPLHPRPREPMSGARRRRARCARSPSRCEDCDGPGPRSRAGGREQPNETSQLGRWESDGSVVSRPGYRAELPSGVPRECTAARIGRNHAEACISTTVPSRLLLRLSGQNAKRMMHAMRRRGITDRKVNWMLNDIRGFFDSLDHGWLIKFIEHRIAERRARSSSGNG